MLDPKYIPLFIGGFIAWICFMIFVGWITSRGKSEGSSFLTGCLLYTSPSPRDS